MRKNDLFKSGESIIRVLATDENRVFCINCKKPQMPKWAEFPFQRF